MAWKNIPEKKVLATLKDGKDLKGVASEKMTIFITGGIPGSEGDVAGLTMTVDPSTYVMTTQLKDKDGGNVGSPATVDLPLESMVVSGEYDEDTKSIILTLKNGQTVSFSVADLVSGLQTEITSENPLDADLIDDSSSNQKLVTDDEKQALEEIVNNGAYMYATMLGGEGYVQFDNDNSCHLDITAIQYGNQDPLGVDMNFGDMWVHLANGASSNIAQFDNSTVTSGMLDPGTYFFDPNSGVQFYIDSNQEYEITDAGTVIAGPFAGDSGELRTIYFIPADGSDPITYFYNATEGTVTESTGVDTADLQAALGAKQDVIDSSHKLSADLIAETNDSKVMTAAERTKLAGIAAGAEVNVQSNWNQTNSSADDYIKNKPTIPRRADFTIRPANLPYENPSSIIDNSNGDIYYSFNDLIELIYTYGANVRFVDQENISNTFEFVGSVIDVGERYYALFFEGVGGARYRLMPNEDDPDNLDWEIIYDGAAETNKIKKVVDTYVKQGQGAPTTSTEGSKGQLYEDTTNGKVYICTNRSGSTYTWKELIKNGDNISTLTNDAGYQDASQVSGAIASAVGGITSFEYQVVQALPVTGEKGVIYLVANSGTTPNIYDEYIWVNNAFEKIGTTDIDLSGYATTQDLEDGLAGKVDAIDPTYLPSGAEQGGIIYVTDHTDIDPDSISNGQIVFDQNDGTLYIAEVTVDAETGENIVTWHEIQTENEVVYIPMTITSVQDMTFTVPYTSSEVSAMLDGGLKVMYRLTIPQRISPSLDAGVYDFTAFCSYQSGQVVMATMVGASGNDNIFGIAFHIPSAMGDSRMEMRFLQSKIDANNKLSADLIDSSSSTNKTYITGSGAPTTSTAGEVGQIYVDTATGKVYVCTDTTGGTYTWVEVSGTQIQSDWNQANSSAVDYIKNKPSLATVATTGAYSDLTGTPTIPTVGDGVLTIRRNGSQVLSFHANATSNSSVNIEVPEITMTTTDPGEGASLAANNFIAVYEA